MISTKFDSGHRSRLVDGDEMVRVADLIRSRAAASPDAVAMRTADTVTSFADLDATSSRVAQALLAAGVTPGDRVAYIGRNSPDFLAVTYGIAKVGAVVAAVNVMLAPSEVTHILDDCAPVVVFVGAGEERLVAAARQAAMPAVVVTAETGPLETWWGGFEPVDPRVDVDGDDTALLLYSSGTTGLPKGIMLTGTNMACALAAVRTQTAMDDTSVSMAPIPFFHIAGLSMALAATLVGAELLTLAVSDPDDLRRVLHTHHVTHAVVVPTLITRLLELDPTDEYDWADLRCIIYGASPIPAPVLERALTVFGCDFAQGYGLTESCGGVTALTSADHRRGLAEPALLTSAGRPQPGVEIRIVDPATDKNLPADERGEILVRAGHVMTGYWNNPAATAAALDGGWLHTGDIGRLDENGYLHVVDRLKDMIVSGGENIYPAEIERVLHQHPDIADCAVVGVPSPTWGETPAAVVIVCPGATLTGEEVVAFTRERLAHYKCPTTAVFVTELPRNASGKILKRAIVLP
jgi:acyl-CoA synthetase (AMP-forming)/AMP-acid ligase II